MRALRAAVALLIFGGCTGSNTCDPTTQQVKYVDWHLAEVGTTADLNSVQLVTGNGWIVGSDGVVGWTDDGGENWTVGSVGTTTALWDVARSDAAIGLIVGDGGAIYAATGDGSFDFTRVDAGTAANLFAIDVDGRNGVVAGDGVLARTTNGGQTFDTTEVGGTFRAITLANAAPWAVGDNGAVATWDGSQWSLRDIGSIADLDAVAFMDADHGVIGGSGEVWITSDGGAHWTAASAPPAEPLTSAVGGFALLATGDGGTVYRSEDFGDTWLDLHATGVAGLRGISTYEDQTMPNTQIIAAAPGGQAAVYGSRFEDEVVDPGWNDCP